MDPAEVIEALSAVFCKLLIHFSIDTHLIIHVYLLQYHRNKKKR
jgi:hypothetical protein